MFALDKDALVEFMESLSDLVPLIERNIGVLKNAAENPAVIADLFRAVHNIKGDAMLCKVEIAVAIVHPIETLLARIRKRELPFSEVSAEAILLAFDRLELAVEALINGRSLDNLRLSVLIQGFEALATAKAIDLDERGSELIKALTGFRPAAEIAHARPADTSEKLEQELDQKRLKSNPDQLKNSAKMHEDLQFFRVLAAQFEARSPLFKGRTTRLLRLALETNQEENNPVDPLQLEAAVYMHDVGMMFLPESVWLKVEPMSTDERKMLRAHPHYADEILVRITGWEIAAQIVGQHHEMPDGQGYPQGLHAHQICPGAKILSIIDAFEAVMFKHIHRGKNRSVLRAMAEINACDNQFAPEWIEPFNRVIRRSLEVSGIQ